MKNGEFTLHTRKCNLDDRYMLGTFIKCTEIHQGKASGEIRRQALYPISSPPPIPHGEEGFFTRILENLPVPVLISSSGKDNRRLIKNRAYHHAFPDDDDGGADEALLR